MVLYMERSENRTVWLDTIGYVWLARSVLDFGMALTFFLVKIGRMILAFLKRLTHSHSLLAVVMF